MSHLGRGMQPAAPTSPILRRAESTTQSAIALGSNLGDSYQILQAAFDALAQTPHISLLARSSIYQTAAVGPPQPDYLNACAILETSLTPEALLSTLLMIEAQFGRVRRERWGPRLLDLDLLLFGDRCLQTPTLQIPHPRMGDRAFVLVPLAEIAGDWLDPTTGQAIAHLVQQCDCSGIQRWEG